jgi:hypothetical protein
MKAHPEKIKKAALPIEKTSNSRMEAITRVAGIKQSKRSDLRDEECLPFCKVSIAYFFMFGVCF